jgi:hypothetical protein
MAIEAATPVENESCVFPFEMKTLSPSLIFLKEGRWT